MICCEGMEWECLNITLLLATDVRLIGRVCILFLSLLSLLVHCLELCLYTSIFSMFVLAAFVLMHLFFGCLIYLDCPNWSTSSIIFMSFTFHLFSFSGHYDDNHTYLIIVKVILSLLCFYVIIIFGIYSITAISYPEVLFIFIFRFIFVICISLSF